MTTILTSFNNAINQYRCKKFWKQEYKNCIDHADIAEAAARHEEFAADRLAWMSFDPMYATTHRSMAKACYDVAEQSRRDAEWIKSMREAF